MTLTDLATIVAGLGLVAVVHTGWSERSERKDREDAWEASIRHDGPGLYTASDGFRYVINPFSNRKVHEKGCHDILYDEETDSVVCKMGLTYRFMDPDPRTESMYSYEEIQEFRAQRQSSSRQDS